MTGGALLDHGLERIRLEPGADLWDRLQSTWNRLYESVGETSPFLSATWMAHWFEHAPSAAAAWAELWYRDGEPVAGIVLSRGGVRIGGVPVRRIYLNASSPPALGFEHNDVLSVPAEREVVLADLARLLMREAEDDIDLAGARAGFVESVRSDLSSARWEVYSSEAPYVDLAALRTHCRDYMDSLSANTRHQIARSMRLYERAYGNLVVELASTGPTRLEWFDEMTRLHDLRIAARGARSGFTSEARSLHRSLVQRRDGAEGDGFSADIMRVSAGTQTIGILYHIRSAGTVHYFQGGFRYSTDNRLKPGLVSHALAVRHYTTDGAREYDFLGGERDPVRYKRSLSGEKRVLYWGRIAMPTLRNRAIGMGRALRDIGR